MEFFSGGCKGDPCYKLYGRYISLAVSWILIVVAVARRGVAVLGKHLLDLVSPVGKLAYSRAAPKRQHVTKKDLRPLRILHVEDEENDAILLVKACERAQVPLQCHWLSCVEDAQAYLLG